MNTLGRIVNFLIPVQKTKICGLVNFSPQNVRGPKNYQQDFQRPLTSESVHHAQNCSGRVRCLFVRREDIAY